MGFKLLKVETQGQVNTTKVFKQELDPFIPILLIEISELGSSIPEKKYLEN